MQFTVGRKLWFGFLAVLLIMIIVGAAGFISLSSLNKEYRFLIDDRVKKVNLFEQLATKQNEILVESTSYFLNRNPMHLEKKEELIVAFDEIISELDKIVASKSAKETMQELKDATIRYREYTDGAVAKYSKGDFDLAVSAVAGSVTYQDTIIRYIDELIEHQKNAMNQTEEEVQSFLLMTRILIIGLIGLAIVVSIVIAQIISRSIARPVGKVTNGIQQIASGDFSVEPILIRNKDEIGEMATAFNEMTKDLRTVITNTRESAVQLAIQAGELSASSEESLAASEMVAEIAEKNLIDSDTQVTIVKTSNEAMYEMVTGIDRIAEDNGAMLLSSEEVARLVGEGSTLMKDFTNQMSTIGETIGQSVEVISQLSNHSEQIRKVTSLIRDIADQTNLLALNAAIEAARAGEHGKGFAVVAEEVRNLAEQSKLSAGEIGRMIDAMIQNVNEAVESTEDGNRRVEDGLLVTVKTSEVFNRIELASNDVSSKVVTVSAAIEQIRTMTEEVANGSNKVQQLALESSAEAQSTSAATEEQLAANEEISSSAQTLAELAEKLQNDMSRFIV